jgi:hypothetical protein
MMKYNPIVDYLEKNQQIPINYKENYQDNKNKTIFNSKLQIKNDFDKEYENKVDLKVEEKYERINKEKKNLLTKLDVKKKYNFNKNNNKKYKKK